MIPFGVKSVWKSGKTEKQMRFRNKGEFCAGNFFLILIGLKSSIVWRSRISNIMEALSSGSLRITNSSLPALQNVLKILAMPG